MARWLRVPGAPWPPRQETLVAIQLDCFLLRQGYGGQVVVPQGALLAGRVAMTV
jgi:hypothetical protein